MNFCITERFEKEKRIWIEQSEILLLLYYYILLFIIKLLNKLF